MKRTTTAAAPALRKEELQQAARTLEAAGVLDATDVQEIELHGAVAAARVQAASPGRRTPSAVEVFAAQGLHDRRSGSPLEPVAATAAIAAQLDLPFERVDPLKLDATFVTRLLSRPFAERHLMIPLREEDEVIVIASARPFDEEGRETARRTMRREVRFVLTMQDDVERVIREFYGFRSSIERAEKQITAPNVDLQNLEQLVRMRGDREIEASDQHVVNAVDYLMRYAFEMRASDIHIEPKRESGVMRFRIDGVLHRIYDVPRAVHLAMVSRIKMLARMDIAEKRRPQDGRIKMQQGERQVEMRVSSLPVAFGENIVVRIFDPQTVHGDLGRLGFRGHELEVFERWIVEPHGIILVTGPTGSGKSTTLYTALMNVATDDVNCVTIEDPIEMLFEHLNQVAVQPQAGVTFAAALRTILRQDPDIIMVGEIRDGETAEYAVQAALTGHLVFSTLHTNDAPTAIPRLTDLGVQSFLLANALVGVMAQRLVRRVCPHCAVEEALPAADLRQLGAAIADDVDTVIGRRGEGCVECRGTGYRGRLAIVEMMEVTASVRAAIAAGGDIEELRRRARAEGMRSLREAGLALVLEGETTIEEVLRVTSDAG
jgi:general secretion pathway protein E